MLLTFNFKGINELTGSPPILIDVPEDKMFKDVLLEVIEKINPLLPEGSKFTIETLGIESFDGEPVSWSTYEKHVFDVIIDFGTSFVVTMKAAKHDDALLADLKNADKEPLEQDKLRALDLTQEVLKTEGIASKDEYNERKREEEQLQFRPEEQLTPFQDLIKAPKGTDVPVGGGKPELAGGMKPSIPITPSPPATEPSLPPAVPGGPAMPSVSSITMAGETRAVPAQPVSASMTVPVIAAPSPPPMAAEEDRRKKEKERAKFFGKPAPKAAPLDRKVVADEAKEFEDGITSAMPPFDEGIITTGDRLAENRPIGAPPAKTQYDKNISVDYFNVMNPENYYPVVVDIADIEQVWKPVEENIITGERKVQVKEKAVFETDTVIVRPVFPGCTVAPSELEADLTKPKELCTFFVTPLVRGAIKGELHFLAKGKLVHMTDLPAEVKDPRVARYIFLYGFIASIIPQIGKLLSIDLETMLNNLVDKSVLLGLPLTTFIAVGGTGVAMIIGLIYFITHKPRGTKMALHLTDFRMTLVPPHVV
nr:hypothetical protein [Candidatus Sigynarchaeum springense]